MRRRSESTNPPENPDPGVFLPLPHLPLHILLALAEEPRHGWSVVQKIGKLTEGRHKPSAGSLYLAMSRLEERGLIEDAPRPDDDTDARRRYFRLTSLGRRVLAAETERLAGLVAISRRSNAARETPGGTAGR
jgi:DNA-binding PadR family transcriptional regulator